MMEIHEIQQGSPKWHDFRARHLNASDAPAMLGVSSYKTRSQLIYEYATGLTPEIDAATQARFDEGHWLEDLARPIAEEIIGDELYPLVGSNGKYAASFDGLTADDKIVWEHKTLNDSIRSACKEWEDCEGVRIGRGYASALPEYLRAQMEQQLFVSGAEKVIFLATKREGETLVERVEMIYEPDESLRQRIITGWEQFEKDVAAYVPEPEAAPEPVGKSPETLPALRIEVSGQVTASNLAEFKATALAVFQNINTDLKTDEDFADAEKTVKWCADVEKRLEAAKEHVLGQMTTVDEVCRTVDELKETSRQIRLKLDKAVKSQKEAIKENLVSEALRAWGEHYADLSAELKSIVALEIPRPNFALAIKGLKTLSSIRNALDTALAQAKIDADALARDYREKLAWFDETAKDYRAIFHNLQQLIAKPLDDFKVAVHYRIGGHRRNEEMRIEAERERIRKEEAAKLEAEQRAKEAGQAAIEGAAKREALAQDIKPAIVADNSDIREFLKTRDFGKEESHIRAVLVEFVRFQTTFYQEKMK
ncbi:MAG: YqaJ viral recombinase family protein [Zoogloeaceae bacterium]|nr:YqaJ viral recombinase family protein [Zoogloeaceae bacterium]